jgi:hypothetical protein
MLYYLTLVYCGDVYEVISDSKDKGYSALYEKIKENYNPAWFSPSKSEYQTIVDKATCFAFNLNEVVINQDTGI